MRQKNKGFTLVEMVITVAIFAILLGILVPSLNSILGFRVQRAANSINRCNTEYHLPNRNSSIRNEIGKAGRWILYYLLS